MNELIKNIRNADEETYCNLTKEWSNRLSIFGYSYIRNNEVVRELVQDVFLILFENRNKISDDTCVVSYMYTIMKNKCLDYIKHQKIKLRYNEKLKQEYIYLLTNQYALEDESINIIVESEIKQALQNAINNLPKKCKEVFIKSRFEGKKYQDIAFELGISEKTVEFHMTKALGSLKKELAHLYFGIHIIMYIIS